MPPALILSGLTKLFGTVRALDALDLTLEAGSIPVSYTHLRAHET